MTRSGAPLAIQPAQQHARGGAAEVVRVHLHDRHRRCQCGGELEVVEADQRHRPLAHRQSEGGRMV
jgi:hypothetical protein